MVICTKEQLKNQRHLADTRGNVPLRLLLEELELRRQIDQHAKLYCPECILTEECHKLWAMRYMLEQAQPFPDAELVPINRVLATAI